jgi:hypothetical protein
MSISIPGEKQEVSIYIRWGLVYKYIEQLSVCIIVVFLILVLLLMAYVCFLQLLVLLYYLYFYLGLSWYFYYLVRCIQTLPWIPEPSTVNNKLKRREGSGIQGIQTPAHAILACL